MTKGIDDCYNSEDTLGVGDTMNLSGLLPFIEETPEFGRLAEILRGDGAATGNGVILDAALPALIAALRHGSGAPLLLVTPTPERARKLTEQLKGWRPSDAQVHLFPEPDVLPYERLSSDQATGWERLKLLSSLIGEASPVVVACAASVSSRTVGKLAFTSVTQVLKPGMKLDLNRTLLRWQAMGYEAEQQVEVPGTFSHRGGIIDIYSPASDFPVRIELFGDEIESLRGFEAETQRSNDPISEVTIIPARDLLIPEQDNEALRVGVVDAVERLRQALGQNGKLSAEAHVRLEEELARLAGGESFPGADFYAAMLNTG